MDWIVQLVKSESVAQAMLVIGVVTALGLALGHIKIWGISLGVAGVLFSGLIVGHVFSHSINTAGHGAINEHILEFAREFGLILFVYTIGIQVGPGFLASLRKQGLPLNIMAAAIVILGVFITVGIHKIGKVEMPAAVGLFSGGTTNTPSLAAAQQALKDSGAKDDTLKLPGLGYAVAYPFGIIGIILTMVLVRMFFRIDMKAEGDLLAAQRDAEASKLATMNIEVRNANMAGLSVSRIPSLAGSGVVISRIRKGAHTDVALGDTKLDIGDVLLAVGPQHKLDEIKLVIGVESKEDLKKVPSKLATRRLIVTKSAALGKTIAELDLGGRFGVMVTRVTRAEIELPPHGLPLNFGDSLTVVGEPDDISAAGVEIGDSLKKLQSPQVIPIFIGIALGVLLGSLPMNVGLPATVKLGLAGGPLVVAIILSRIGHIGPLVWYLPQSSNFVMREIGISLFLACVGLKAGDRFISTLTTGDGVRWMFLAAIITFVPIMLVALFARIFLKTNYLSLCGLLAGSMTDPPALAFAGTLTGSDAPHVSYAAVYPLVMLLRVVCAQGMVLLFM